MLFVVALSQLVSDEIIALPKIGAVGFHPTDLPKGRGRAPLAWMVTNCEAGAVNFVAINGIADSGPIFVNEHFGVTAGDDAASVEAKVCHTMIKALDRWLPELKKGIWNPIEQDHRQATEYSVRKPDDGLLDFAADAYTIHRLIKAAAPAPSGRLHLS